MELLALNSIAITNLLVFGIIAIILGIICIIFEMVQPGFGIFGITGILLSIGGIVMICIAYNGKHVWLLASLLTLGVLALLGLSFYIVLKSMKSGRISKSGFISNSLAAPEGLTEGTEDYSFLVGKEGMVVSELKPLGNVEIDGKVYDATAEKVFIQKGHKVVVTSVEGVKIVVKEDIFVEDK